MSIEDYKRKDKPVLNKKDNGQEVERRELLVQFAKYLHELKPVLKEEYAMLERINNIKPNKIFPLKMEALGDIYHASDVLYKWYITNAN